MGNAGWQHEEGRAGASTAFMFSYEDYGGRGLVVGHVRGGWSTGSLTQLAREDEWAKLRMEDKKAL